MVIKYIEISCDCIMGYKNGGYCQVCLDGINAEIKDLRGQIAFQEKELERLIAVRAKKISGME